MTEITREMIRDAAGLLKMMKEHGGIPSRSDTLLVACEAMLTEKEAEIAEMMEVIASSR